MSEQEFKLEWCTVAGNRYEVPCKIDAATLETEPFQVDPKLGIGHLELDGEAVGPDYQPGDAPIVVNIRLILLAKGKLGPQPEPPPDEKKPKAKKG